MRLAFRDRRLDEFEAQAVEPRGILEIDAVAGLGKHVQRGVGQQVDRDVVQLRVTWERARNY